MAKRKHVEGATGQRKGRTGQQADPSSVSGQGDDEATAGGGQAGSAVVGVGASAGGLDAFKQLLTALPADTHLAFVLIQHLDPTHESLTVELLARHTEMPVLQVTDAVPIEPNHVYVIPPNKYLTISGRALHLTEPLERRGVRMPIDFFFRSLADDQQERAIGVILTGSGTDGALGVREIKANGGMVIVQTPDSAQFDSMPRSAVATGMVDHVVPIERMAEVLLGYVRHWYVNGGAARSHPEPKAPDHLNTVLALLRSRVKYDFSGYKKGTLTRRIQRRLGLNDIDDMASYVALLRDNQDELNALYKDLLIGVTNFFREPEAWKALEDLVVGPMIERIGHPEAAPPEKPAANGIHRAEIRVWVPGCATGEEAYSIAMLVTERMRAADQFCDLQVFASDIDRDALAFARAGVYPENIAADIPPERFRQFLVKGDHTYRINREVRESVVFAEQNVYSDPPFSKLDLISCRNLLIYLEPEVQQRVMALFHFALRDGGYLFLGNSETVTQQADLFQPVSRKWRIYRRLGSVRHERVAFPAQSPSRPQASAIDKPIEPRARHLATLAQHLMLQHFAPACVLINRSAEVLYLNGSVDQYLQLPSGVLGADLIGMARDGLRTRLRAAVRQAIRDQRRVELSGVRLKRGTQHVAVQVVVEPVPQPKEAELLLLVWFGDQGAPPASRRTDAATAEPPQPAPAEADFDYEAIVRHLDEELRNTREDLQCTIEELETSNEEFKSANEEVMSINEELQSTNEELETSKEELQSLNEELQTVNNQLEHKVTELETVNNDLSNLLSSTQIATIFLDREFRLRRFTPATTPLLRVIDTDIGRPISDLARYVTDDDLLHDAHTVLRELGSAEKEVPAQEGRWYLRRIVPYRTEENRIGGVVVTFTDITSRRAAEESLRSLAGQLEQRVVQLETANTALSESEERFRTLLELAPDAVIVADGSGVVVQVNRRTEELFGYRRDELLGQPVDRLLPPDLRERYAEQGAAFPASAEDGEIGPGRQRMTTRKDGRQFAGEWQFQALELRGRSVSLALVRDVTERNKAEQARARLAAIMQNNLVSVLVLDTDGTILNWNRGAEQTFGHSEQEAVGRNVRMLLPRDREGEFDRLTARLRRGESVESVETAWLHKQGSVIHVVLTISPIDVVGYCWIAVDIRNRKHLEQQLTAMTDAERQRLGREVHDSLSQQIVGLGMLITGLGTHARSGTPMAKLADQLEVAIDVTKQQLRALVKGLLPVSIEAAGLHLALQDLAEETERAHGIACQYECPEDVPLRDNFVATQLLLIAREAVWNAVRHAQATKIVIRLTDHDGVQVAVEDNGVGLPHDVYQSPGMGRRIMAHRCGLVGGVYRESVPADGGTLIACVLSEAVAYGNREPSRDSNTTTEPG
jgi:two-component system, chemotaxis family, CheB/CheR fusion protein